MLNKTNTTLNLILDWGNTKLKCAVFETDTIKYNNSFSENIESELRQLLTTYNITQCILSSVVNHPPFIKVILEEYNGLELSNTTPIPIHNNYDTPETLGNDRLANAVALSKLYPNNNALSIDIGTCLKFDFITNDKAYQGGAISPGLDMRLNAMHHFTDKLPYPELTIPSDLIGKSTNSSLLSGAYFGMLAEITQIINFYKIRFDDLIVVATGGDWQYFEKELKNSIFANSFLTLIGLNEILKYNNGR